MDNNWASGIFWNALSVVLIAAGILMSVMTISLGWLVFALGILIFFWHAYAENDFGGWYCDFQQTYLTRFLGLAMFVASFFLIPAGIPLAWYLFGLSLGGNILYYCFVLRLLK